MNASWLDLDERGGRRAVMIAAGLAALAAEGAHGIIDVEIEIAGLGPFWQPWVAARGANRSAWWYTL